MTSAPPTSLAVFALVGLLGGAHCLGMCGPLVTMYADRLAAQRDGGASAGASAGGGAPAAAGSSGSRRDRPLLSWHDVRQHLLFNLGRTLSYAVIGAIMGALGAVLFDAAAVVALATPIRSAAGILIGLFIVGTGLVYLFRGSVGHGGVPGFGGLFARAYGAVTDRVDDWVGGPRIAALGALHGFLPCPILYPAFLYALARGSPVEGFLALGTLGLGTLPTLFAYGTVFQSVDAGTRVRLHRALGVAFVVLGYLPLSMGLMGLGIQVPHPDIPIYQPFS
jgi:sulfite exporter TauE/SafE